jgi:hypothetical protein
MIGRVAEAYRRYLERNRMPASQFWFVLICFALIIIILVFVPESRNR